MPRNSEPQVMVSDPGALLPTVSPPPGHVLIIRSGPPAMFERAIRLLESAFPGVRISQLCHVGQEDRRCDSLVYPGQGYFRSDSVDMAALRTRGFDLAVLLYATDRRLHPEYHEVDSIARLSGARRIIALYWDGPAVELTPELLDLKQETVVKPWQQRRDRAVAEICAFTGEDAATVLDKCDLAAARGNDEWSQAAPKDDEEITAFYCGSDFYIYALMKECDWRGARSGLADDIAPFLHPGERVLDYGGGVGTLVLELAGQGVHLYHLDLPGRLIEFAASRFTSRSLEVEVIPAFDRYPLNGRFEAICCTHVLEHLPDPERKLAHMAAHLSDGGRLFLALPFEPNPVGGAHPHMHLNRLSPERYTQLTAELGLELLERRDDLDFFRRKRP